MVKILSPPASYCARSIVTLDGASYRLRLRYDERNESWYLDARTAPGGSPIVDGWRLTDGTAVETYGAGWPGALGAMPVARGTTLHEADDLLEGRSVLVYYPESEIMHVPRERYSVRRTEGPTPPVPFDPLTLGPLIWLDASDVATMFIDSAGTVPVVADGDPVGRWANKGTLGAAGDAVQTVSANRPIFREGATGKPYVDISGIQSLLFGNGAWTLPDDATIVMWMTPRQPGTTGRYFTGTISLSKRIVSRSINGFNYQYPGGNVVLTPSSGYGPGYSEVWSKDGDYARVQRKDLVATSVTVQSGYTPHNNYSLGYTTGIGSGEGFETWSVMVIPGKLDDDQRSKLRGYLEAKHAL